MSEEKSLAQFEDYVRRSQSDEDELRKQLLAAQQEAGMWKIKYVQLQQIYNKLADQWNVFQATNRPDNRNIQRAEGAGEVARKLAEVLLGVAYSTDVRDLLRKLLEDMEGSGGRTVEMVPANRLVPDTMKMICPRCNKLTTECRCG